MKHSRPVLVRRYQEMSDNDLADLVVTRDGNFDRQLRDELYRRLSHCEECGEVVRHCACTYADGLPWEGGES